MDGHEDLIDLLLTDMIMPVMDGKELAERLKKKHPGLKMLFMSGYPERSNSSSDVDEGVTLLEKPFLRESLARAVRKALDQR
jgi:two-component system, cell cycle sensor histidine kinase and response regulator CckA